MTMPTLALPPGKTPCTRCGAVGVVRPDNRPCPRCRGRRYEPTPRGPRPDFEQAKDVLYELQALGKARQTWRDSRSADAAARREGIRAEIRRVVAKGKAMRIYADEMADALGISVTQMNNIMRGEPSGRKR